MLEKTNISSSTNTNSATTTMSLIDSILPIPQIELKLAMPAYTAEEATEFLTSTNPSFANLPDEEKAQQIEHLVQLCQEFYQYDKDFLGMIHEKLNNILPQLQQEAEQPIPSTEELTELFSKHDSFAALSPDEQMQQVEQEIEQQQRTKQQAEQDIQLIKAALDPEERQHQVNEARSKLDLSEYNDYIAGTNPNFAPLSLDDQLTELDRPYSIFFTNFNALHFINFVNSTKTDFTKFKPQIQQQHIDIALQNGNFEKYVKLIAITTIEHLVLNISSLQTEDNTLAIAAAAKQNKCIKSLTINGHVPNQELFQTAITNLLTENTSVTSLVIDTNDDETKFITDLLLTNGTIDSLNIYNISEQSAGDVGNLIKGNNTIKKLYLYGDAAIDDSTKLILDGLKNNTALVDLTLTQINISAEDAKSLADIIANNQTLTDLLLISNEMDAVCTKFIADALLPEKNQTLTHLKIAANNIEPEGVEYIAGMLQKNKKIIYVDLAYNEMDDKGAQCMASMLLTNDTLLTLNLGSNKITDIGAKSLIDSLKTNKTILSLNCNLNEQISPENMETILYQTMDNKTIQTALKSALEDSAQVPAIFSIAHQSNDNTTVTSENNLLAMPEINHLIAFNVLALQANDIFKKQDPENKYNGTGKFQKMLGEEREKGNRHYI
jgi:hypothetical protein